MPIMRNIVLGTLVAALIVAVPISYKRWRDRDTRNFHVVQEGVLYRSGQLPLARLQQIVSAYGIRTVISLRDGSKRADEQEEAWISTQPGLKFERIPYRSWWPDVDGKIPGDESVATFRKIMDDPANYPVLVHCFAGIHRTGTMCAVFRMDYQGWTNAQAIAEMRVMGYTVLDDHEDVLAYVTNYRPPHAAKAVRGEPALFRKPAGP
jgi:protein tyrosine/serine phosphatase